MNTAGSAQGGHHPSDWHSKGWLGKVEQATNRVADKILEGAESMAKKVEAKWESVTRRLSRNKEKG